MSDDITPEDIIGLMPESLRRWNELAPEIRAEHILCNSTSYQEVVLHRETMRNMLKFFEEQPPGQHRPEMLDQLKQYLTGAGWK